MLVEGRDRIRARGGDADLEAFFAEHEGQRVRERLFILDDKHTGH